jgi:hypothetical protein
VTDSGRRYWPWWWQFQQAAALLVGTALVILEGYRGTYNPVAMGFAFAAFGLAAITEGAKAVLRRANGGGGPS